MSPERTAALRASADPVNDLGPGISDEYDEMLDELERMQAALRRQRRPEFVQFPPQFGHVWVNPFRVDSIEINKGGTEHVVTLRVREQRIRSVEGLKLTADQAADLVTNLLAMIRRGDG